MKWPSNSSIFGKNNLTISSFFFYILQAHAPLYLPSSDRPAKCSHPDACPVHYISVHRLHDRKPGLYTVHHSCLWPVPIRRFPCSWLHGIRLHRHSSATSHGRQPDGSGPNGLRAVPAYATTTRSYAVEAWPGVIFFSWKTVSFVFCFFLLWWNGKM